MSIVSQTPRTAHQRAQTKQAKSRKPAAPLPAWASEVGKFLERLNLAPFELRLVCNHLDRYRKAEGVPVLRKDDVETLAAIISRDGKQARPGDVGTPAHARQVEIAARVARVMTAAEPTASTPFTPEPMGSFHPSQQDWDEYGLMFDRVETQVETVSTSVPSVRSSTTAPRWMMSAEQARYLALSGPGHHA